MLNQFDNNNNAILITNDENDDENDDDNLRQNPLLVRKGYTDNNNDQDEFIQVDTNNDIDPPNPLSVKKGYIDNNLIINSNGLSGSNNIFTSIPLNSPSYQSIITDDKRIFPMDQPDKKVYFHKKIEPTIDDKYLSFLNISRGVAQKKSNAAMDLKSGRKWLNRIIIAQTCGNVIRALPIFILEKYYVMLLIFFQAIFYLIGLYGVKRIKQYLILLYVIGCFGTTILDFVILLTYAHGQSSRPFNEAQVAFWAYVLFDAALCILNIFGGVFLGLKLFISTVTLKDEDEGRKNLLVFAAHLIGSFENPEEDEELEKLQQYKNNQCIYFYGSDIRKAISTTLSITKTFSFETLKKQIKYHYDKWRGITIQHHQNNNDNTTTFSKSSFLQRSSVPTKTSSNLLNTTSNQVITSKYNIFTFLPKVIFYQFSRLANLYTLCIVTLCMFSFSPVGPISSLTPLLVVIFVTGFKEFMEDIKRHKQDNEINNRKTQIYKPPGSFDQAFNNDDTTGMNSSTANILTNDHLQLNNGIFIESIWKDIMVGDIILVKNGEALPADMICLSTSRSDGRTYLETANLDGETNLKAKSSISKCSWIRSPEDLDNFSCKVDYEAPTNDIYSFEGVLTILKDNTTTTGKPNIPITSDQPNYVPIGIDQLLLRGTKLRNTEWVIGIVVYTGVDTKVEKNSTKINQKRSTVERGVNSKLIILFLLQTTICIICSIGHNRWHLEGDKESKPWYMGLLNTETDFIYVSYVILYNTLIPLSMYVSMEVIRVSNAHFIDSDLEMYDEATDTPAQARNTNINEELGQIQYLFTDKTGTLTCNEMKFNTCTVGGKIYGPQQSSLSLLSSLQKEPIQNLNINNNNNNNNENIPNGFTQLGQSITLTNSTSGQTQLPFSESLPITDSEYIKEFLLCLAICNTVLVENQSTQPVDNNLNFNQSNPSTSSIKYQAASPDEESLTLTASKYGYILKSRDDNVLTVTINGKDERFEVLNTLEFNAYRKRMSVIIRMPETNEIRLYCKGADSVIGARISKDQGELWKQTEQHLSHFASQGLRTLCMSMKIITNDQYQQWSRIYQEAAISLSKKNEKIEQACELIEKELTLIGATGIEDRLQDQVPETIQSLREAGIKIWVLTGDKQETAISIATTSSVLNSDMNLIILNEGSKVDLMKKLFEISTNNNFPQLKNNMVGKWKYAWMEKIAKYLRLDASDVPKIMKLNQDTNDYQHIALVIDGSTLQWALDKDLRYYFLQIAKGCESVICCRCSPSQKAKVVKLVSERSLLFGDGAITMSIGDGANDVPMIRGAHVGVGISGREGMQAVLASDFAIANFSMLQRLLLVHGNRSYKRMTKLILYSFSKNVTFSLTNFWFGFFSGFSGQMIYFDFLFTLYNALFTSLPVLNLGTFDQDTKEEDLMSQPHLYRECQSNRPFNTWNFTGWLLNGIWHSAVIFFVTFFTLESAFTDGKPLGLWAVGTAAYIYLVFTVNIQISLITRYWIRSSAVLTITSMVASILFILIYSVALPVEPDAYFVGFEILSMPNFWFLLIIVPSISLLPYIIITLNSWLFSNDYYYSTYSKSSIIKMEKI